ncbi:MAG: T9SS type A sorting domain-containing protein [Bacteroidia bacterium]
MKKVFLPLLCLTVLLGINTKSNAQYRLVNGAPLEYNIVTEPLLFWDLMRFNFPSFVRQVRYNVQSDYTNANQMLQTKDESGRFDFLQTSLFNPSTQEWIVLDKHEYIRNYETGYKLINEVKDSYVRANASAPLIRERTVSRFYYNGDNPSEITESTTDGGSTTISTYLLQFTFDGNRRIADTLIGTERKNVANYTYNNEGKCIVLKSAFQDNPDSLTAHILFSYTLGKLDGIHIMIFDDTLVSKRYSYQNDKLTEVKFFNNDFMGNLTEVNWYKHGYNNEGKLQWVASFNKQGNVWSNTDSMYFNHNNNKIDTSYGYTGNTSGWNPTPTYRLIFDNITVGLLNPNPTVEFVIYPNPATDLVQLEMDANTFLKKVEITDLVGRVVAQPSTLTNNQLDVSGLKSGVYFVKIDTNKGIGLKKMIIN